MKKIIIFCAAVMLVVSAVVVGAENGPQTFLYGTQIEQKDINYVSEYALVGSPGDYDGKKVRFVGVLNIEPNNSCIYLSTEDYKNKITKNAIWININIYKYPKMSELNGKYVMIEGVYNGLNTGHTNYFAGAVDTVTKIQEWK